MQLAGKVAVITGGARGLGRGIAAVMAERGAAIAAADIDAEGARQSAQELAAASGRDARAYGVDVTSQADFGGYGGGGYRRLRGA